MHVERSVIGEGAPADAASRFGDPADDASRQVGLLYPLDGAVFFRERPPATLFGGRIPGRRVGRLVRTIVLASMLVSSACGHPPGVLEVFAVAGGPSRLTERPTLALGHEVELTFAQLERLGDGAISQSAFRPSTVRSADPDRIEVVSADGDRVVVRGTRPGRARLLVVRGEARRVVEVEVGAVDRVRIEHGLERLGHDPDALAYLAGATVRFELAALAASGAEVRGEGLLAAADVSIEGRATLVAIDDTHLDVVFEDAGRVELEVRGARRVVDVVPLEAVHSLALVARSYDFGAGCSATPFATMRVAAAPEHGERPSLLVLRALLADGRIAVGVEGVAALGSETPATCTARPARQTDRVAQVLRFFRPDSRGFQLEAWDLLGGQPGECVVSASIGDASTRASIRVGAL